MTTRRSVRSFTNTPVPVDKIHQLLAYAAFAPSSGNSQPWEVVLIDDADALERCTRFNPYADFSGRAPLGMVICGNLENERFEGFWVQDCAAYTQNIVLAAHDQGLGTLWTGIYPAADRVRKYKAVLSLPTNIVPMALVLIGYTDRKLPMPTRSMEGKVHYNRYGATAAPLNANFNSGQDTAGHSTTFSFLRDTTHGTP